MTKRFSLILGATLVAICILGLTLWLGPGTETGASRDTAASRTRLDPEDLPPGVQPESLEGGDPREAGLINPEGDAGRGRMTRVEQDRTTVLTWQTIEPGRAGVYEIGSPTVRVKFHQSPQSPSTRALTVTAKQATIVAPEGTFRRGEFRQDVLVTLFRSPEGRAVSLKNPAHARMTVSLPKNAAFDLELGKLTSTGPVHLASRRVDFRGTGLSLKYNQLRRRIERLVIDQGKALRFETDQSRAQTEADESPPVNAQLASSQETNTSSAGPGSGEAADESNTHDSTDKQPPQSPRSPHSPQFYHARFAKDIRIRTNPDSNHVQAEGARDKLKMTGNALDVVFALESQQTLSDDSSGEGESPPPGPSPKPDSQPGMNHEGNAPSGRKTPGKAESRPTNHESDRPLTAERFADSNPDDVIIRWTGRLVVNPLRESDEASAITPNTPSTTTSEPRPPQGGYAPHQANTSPRISRPEDPKDIRLSLQGTANEPAQARTAQNQTISGRQIAYRTANQALRVEAGQAHPMILASPALGTLRGRRLVLHRGDAEGYVLGPGRITAASSPEANDRADDDRAKPSTIAWADRLDLAFFRGNDAGASAETNPDETDDAMSGASQIAALRQARFHGQVQARHDRMHLAAQRLDIAFERDADQPNRSHPTRVIADKQVRARRPDLRFSAGHLNAVLGQDTNSGPETSDKKNPPAASESAENQETDGQGQAGDLFASSQTKVRRFTASKNVKVDLAKQNATIHANRLAAAPGSEMVELFGHYGKPAVLSRPDGRLSGDRIMLDDQTGKVRVIGPGDFTHHPDQSQPNPDGSPEFAEDRPPKLNVVWQRAMTFDNQQRTAQFHGKVQARTEKPTEVNQLASEDLRLTFAPSATNPKSAEGTDDEEQTETSQITSADSLGDLRQLTARDNVAFTSTHLPMEYPDKPKSAADLAAQTDQGPEGQAKPLTRIHLEGPVLTLENKPANQANASKRKTTHGRPSDDEQIASSKRVKRVEVNGPGRMLIEDYRTNSDTQAQSSQAQSNTADPGFTGRGATLFHWSGGLTLDQAAGQMVMTDQVEMIHRPLHNPAQVLQLNAERLTAQLSDKPGQSGEDEQARTEPLANADNPGQLELSADRKIQTIRAEHSVRVTRGEQVIDCDVLRYNRDKHRLVLIGKDRKIQAYENGKPASLAARRLIWDLKNNRIEARQATGGGRLPANQ